MMTVDALPIPNAAVVFQVVSDGAVLLHTQEEVYYGLNAVGVVVWGLLGECRDFEELRARLAVRYPDVSSDQLRTDAEELIEALQSAGLVVPRP